MANRKVPLEPGHPRESTLRAWHQQGLPEGVNWRDSLMQILDIQREPAQPRVDLGVSFKMIPTFEEKVLEHRDGHYVVQDWMGAITEISDEYDYTYIRAAKDFHPQVAPLSGARPPGLGGEDQVALRPTLCATFPG